MENEIFRQGVAAVKAGDRVTALKRFQEFVKQNPESEDGWLALGYCLDNVKLKEYCYKKVLSLNPDNETANKFLQSLYQPQISETEKNQTTDKPAGDKFPSDKRSTRMRLTKPAILGFFLGFIVVGGLLFLLINSYPPPFIDQIARVIVPFPGAAIKNGQATETTLVDMGLPPTWTPILTPDTIRGQKYTPKPLLSMSQRLIDNYSKVENARKLMNFQNFAEAILAWDEVINIIPEYADAYYHRGVCYLMLTKNQRSLVDYIENSQRAFDDFTMAIELNPPKGYYYKARYDVTINLTEQFEFQVDKIPLYQQRLNDALQAYELGSFYPWQTRDVGIALHEAGYCEKSLDYLLRLEEKRGEDATPSATINSCIAYNYVCLGQFQKALGYIEKAISILENREADTQWERWRRVQILIALKRYTEAFASINTLIEERPHYGGWRYYDRAYLYYIQGEPELAYNDLEQGSANTWLQYGMRAYVLALLALDERDEDSGLYWLQIAEASLPKISLPHIYENTLQEIDRLGGTLLHPTPTPSPTPVASPTPIPVIADHVYFTPTPASVIVTPTLTNYSGMGPFYLGSGNTQNFLFRPKGYHDFYSIESLTLKVTAAGFSPGSQITALFMLLDGSGFTGPISLFSGENEIPNPQKIVSNSGYFHVGFRNDDFLPVVIENISVQLIVKDQDGTTVVYGYE